MRLVMLAPRSTVRGPLPKHTPLLVDALRRLGCEVELLPWGRRTERERLVSKLWGRALDVRSARREIVRGNFRLVVVKTAHDWLTLTRDLALLRVLPRDVVTILQFHGSQSPRLLAPGSRAFKRATAALLSRADGILVLSREEQAEWKSFRPQTRVLVVRNARPDPPRGDRDANGRRDGPPIILSVARLMAGKGGVELLRALPRVLIETPCRLVFVGDGPEERRLRELSSELGVAGAVEFRGYLEGSDLANAYRAAEVFALPTSLSEGFPTAILEAMAVGLPVVTTPARGPADHLVEGRHALFVPALDEIRLAEALVRLLHDADLRREMGEANRAKVHDFDADVVAREYLAALDEIAEGSRSR